VPWLNPVDEVGDVVAPLDVPDPEAPPEEPLPSSPLVPAPETPGTDSGVEEGLEPLELDAVDGSVPGFSPVPDKLLRIT